MNQRNALQTRIVENLAGPLMAAIINGQGRDGPIPAAQFAGQVAELLGSAIQLAIAMSNDMDLRGEPEEADSVRLALTALSGRLVGDLYRQYGRTPDEAEVKKLLPALEAALTFSDKFTPAADAATRLERLQPGTGPTDLYQAEIQYMSVFVPVIAEASLFAFGRQERKFLQDVAERLTDQATAMRQRLFPDATGDQVRACDLSLLKALADIYVACHRQEKDRIVAMASQNGDSGLEPLDGLWALFQERAAMLESLSSAVAGRQQTAAGGPAPRQTPQQARPMQQPQQQPVQQQPPMPPQAPPPPPTTTTGEPPAAPANPMAFFTARKSQEE